MHDQIARVLEHKGRYVETTPPQASVFDAVDRMNAAHIGALLVVDEPSRVIGILTERDVLIRVVAAGRWSVYTRVRDVMTPNPITVRATATVTDALELMSMHRCGNLPVLDDRGLCGLVSIGDLTSWLVQDQRRTIEDLHSYIRAA
jgi:CBS domain-containing protein